MKKTLSTLFLASFLTLMVVPIALAVEPGVEIAGQCTMRHTLTSVNWTAKGFICPASGAACLFNNPALTCGTCCLMDAVYTVTDWVFVFVFVVAGIMIVYGGFVLATSAGTPEKVTTGRNYILYGAIGVVIALLAKAIPTLVTSILQLGA